MSSLPEPPQVLHIISRLDGYGAARLLRRLAARQAAGRGATVVALQNERPINDELERAGVAVHALNARWPVDPIAAWRLVRLRSGRQFDVVHAWDARALAHALLSGGTKDGLSLVVSLDGVDFRKARPRRLVRRADNRGALFLAADPINWELIAQYKVHPSRVWPIPLGALAAEPSPVTRDQLLAELGLPADAGIQLIATAGPLERGKQIDEAIWCFELVRVLHPQARLLVFGDGADRGRLERFARQVSEPGCVRFLGFRDDLRALLPHFHAFWQLDPAAVTPLALVESMAAGIPVVASDVPAHRAAVDDGRTGWLVPPADRAAVARAMDELLGDAVRARSVGGAAAAEVALRWPLQAPLEAYEQAYAHARR